MKQLSEITLVKKIAEKSNLDKEDIVALTNIWKTVDVRLREIIATLLGKSKRLEAVDVLCNIVIKDKEQGVRTTGAISVLDIARRHKDNKKAIRYILNKAIHPLLLAGGRYGTSKNINALGWVFLELIKIGDRISVLTAEDKDNIIKALAKYYKATLNADARKSIQRLLDELGAGVAVAELA